MKLLRETLAYSLNESSSLAELFDYRELSREIKSLCNSIARLFSVNEENADHFNSLSEIANALTTKTKLISSKEVRR